MPSYQRLGKLPQKRHTQFRKPDGSLYHEEIFGTEAFSGVYSTLYHEYAPTRVSHIKKLRDLSISEWQPNEHRHHHIRTKNIETTKDVVEGRQPLFYNSDVFISSARPTQSMESFFRNAQGDELYFVHEGRGTLESVFGLLPFHEGDFIVVPRGTTYRIMLDSKESRFLVAESAGPIEIPRRYRNDYGQLVELAPYSDRDFREPKELAIHNEKGEFEVRMKVDNALMSYTFDFHPLDVVGWDGYLYPWIFNVNDFEPLTGRVHQPPPIHQTFEAPGFDVLSFVPRKLDYHPLAIPVPYNHSNIDSDEILYYVSGDFGSRRGIEIGSYTLHRRGIHHGPQPGAIEASLGKDSTNELAIMIETKKPLRVTSNAERLDDPNYPFSWMGPVKIGATVP
ncbi:homogentisate 1,2-dioxygenase [Candidatus Bathyarchaeota archaeon]|nr:MAG: homogentisate 1,2-dioxygenase [Candidatus Bathyarchaeota archaeon]